MSTIDTPHGIPTRYRGVNFRSRLKAKYAALFDLLGWEMDVRTDRSKGWSPDFAIGVKTPILVEVRPIFEFDENCHRCQSPGRSAAR